MIRSTESSRLTVTRPVRRRAGALLMAGLCLASGNALGDVWHVRADAGNMGDGTSWTRAFSDLQMAIDMAIAGDEIWVTGGTYRPDRGTGNRTMSFRLVEGVGIYGGFAGKETSRRQRAQEPAFASILSGDLAGDDVVNSDGGCGSIRINFEENAFHVVVAENVGPAAVLDGFAVIGGNASGSFPNDRGAGLLCSDASPTVTQVGFLINQASSVGAGTYLGGASAPRLVSCGYFGNTSLFGGSAIYAGADSQLTLVNGLVHFNDHFGGNGEAGGIYIASQLGASLVNCTISKNTSSQHVDGVFIHPSVPAGAVRIVNSILWDNGEVEIGNGSGGEPAQAVVSYSCVRGGFSGEGNISTDPMFADMSCDALPLPDPRLLAGSPCVDAASAFEYDGPYVDHNYLRPGQGRFVDDPSAANVGIGIPVFLDMGAFERQANGQCIADLDGDGDLDSDDFFFYLDLFVQGCP